MVYVVAATWTAAPGNEVSVAGALTLLAVEARREEGCLRYITNRSSERPCEFFIYEQYTGKNAFDAHVGSAHFQRYGRETAIPLLEARGRALYQLLD